jgi:hypothetical protein
MSCNKTTIRTNVKMIFLHTIYQNSDTFRSILNIFRKLINISVAYKKMGGLLNKFTLGSYQNINLTTSSYKPLERSVILQPPHLTNQFYTATTCSVISADILWKNFNVFNNPTTFLYMLY